MNQNVVLILRNVFIKYLKLLYETNNIGGFVQHSDV